jgi:hypothetical protein
LAAAAVLTVSGLVVATRPDPAVGAVASVLDDDSASDVASAVAVTATPSDEPDPAPTLAPTDGNAAPSTYDGPAVAANFAGLGQGASCECAPPDPNAAVSPTQIVEVVNRRFQVTSKTGNPICGFSLNTLLNTTVPLGDPRVEYDNVFGRFIFVMTTKPTSTSATPTIFLGATKGPDPCASWWIYRATFTGTAFPAGTFLDFPMLGQDRNALLMTAISQPQGGGNSIPAFSIPKSLVYAGLPFRDKLFALLATCAPVSNGGVPMIATPFSYFLCAVPGTGYLLYRMANSGSPVPTMTLQAQIPKPFTAPTKRVTQPKVSATLAPSDGRISWSPVNDGRSIWFAHTIDKGGFTTVRYGEITTATNAVTVGVISSTETSDDFNASIGVGFGPPNSGETIFLNWAETDAPNGIATTDRVDSFGPGVAVHDLFGTGRVLVSGSTTNQGAFGDYSSVAIDPAVRSGACAVTAQQYFAPDGSWQTRIARVGAC